MIDYKKQKNCHVQLYMQFLILVCLKIIKFIKIALICLCQHMTLLYHVNNNLPNPERYNVT